MNKFLVMLSAYNGEKFIRTQIESILAQKDVGVHILVRDDGSKDKTADLLREYSADMIQLTGGSHEGVCRSFFSLIREAELIWDYYAFCDQDDCWEPEKLKTAAELLKKHPAEEPALYYSGQKVTDENLNIIYFHDLDVNRTLEANYIFNQSAGCTMVFNRKFMELLKQHLPDGNYIGHDVWCYKLCAAVSGNIAVESRGHILYRQHGFNCVGLGNSLRNKANRAKMYYMDQRPSLFSGEILTCYSELVSEKWKTFLNNILDASSGDRNAKKALFLSKDIRFHNPVLRLIFLLKVLTGRI